VRTRQALLAVGWPAGLALVAGLWLGITLRPVLHGDDAAITFRYAERLATGRGFTYNDHERVQGASNPLYALTLAAGAKVGMRIEDCALVLGVATLALAAALAAHIATRLAGTIAGLVAGGLLLLDTFYRHQALGGLEVGFTVVLGLGAFVALLWERPSWAGALLGLALWKKRALPRFRRCWRPSPSASSRMLAARDRDGVDGDFRSWRSASGCWRSLPGPDWRLPGRCSCRAAASKSGRPTTPIAGWPVGPWHCHG
jgi:hypothetical protein